MKLIKLFEEFIAEAANPNYPVGEYDYSYVDKDFKPLGQPLKLKVKDVPALDNPADWLYVELIVHKQSLELYPLDPAYDSSIKTARPDIFSHPAFRYAGKPNPWPAGTAYIKIYKKGETPQIGAEGNFKFQNGQTYKYQFIDAMGKEVTQKTVTIVPNSYYPLEKYELLASGVIKVRGTHGEYGDMMAAFQPPAGQPETSKNSRGLDLQSTQSTGGQPNVFSHPDFNDINNKTIYQVKVFPNSGSSGSSGSSGISGSSGTSGTAGTSGNDGSNKLIPNQGS